MNLPVLQRDCLEIGCSLCCDLPVVNDLGKPSNTRCTNLDDAGQCSIYDDGRPECCREFMCQWRGDQTFPAHLAPSLVGGYFKIDQFEGVFRISFFEQENHNWRKTPVIEFLQDAWFAGMSIFVYSPQPNCTWRTIGFEAKSNGKVFPVDLLVGRKGEHEEEHLVPIMNRHTVDAEGGFSKLKRKLRKMAKANDARRSGRRS